MRTSSLLFIICVCGCIVTFFCVEEKKTEWLGFYDGKNYILTNSSSMFASEKKIMMRFEFFWEINTFGKKLAYVVENIYYKIKQISLDYYHGLLIGLCSFKSMRFSCTRALFFGYLLKSLQKIDIWKHYSNFQCEKWARAKSKPE